MASFQPGASWSHSWKEVMKFQCPDVVWPHHALLNTIVTSALNKDHEKRPSAAELLEMLMTGWNEEDNHQQELAAVPVKTTPLKHSGEKKKPTRKRVDAPAPPSPPNNVKKPREAKAKKVKKKKKDKKEKSQVFFCLKEPEKNKRVAALKAAAAAAPKARYPLRNRSNK